MKQLFIMPKDATFNSESFDGTVKDAGNIDLYYANKPKEGVTPPLTDNPILTYWRGKKSPAASLEIDKDTLRVTLAQYKNLGDNVPFKAKIDLSNVTPTAGFNYTLVLVKRGVVFNERSNWTATTFIPMGRTMTAAQLAEDLATQFKNMAEFDAIPLTVEYTEGQTTFTIKGDEDGFEQWTVKAGDELAAVSGVVDVTDPVHVTLDKGYIQDLASRCAADKGFEYLYQDGDSIYPGYPEEVDSDTYDLITLRFAVGRAAGKQIDDRATQVVHIAVPAGKGADIAQKFVEKDKIIIAKPLS